ncbi:MAG: hypothetical protein AB1730_17005 [Myxococcota bacterium]
MSRALMSAVALALAGCPTISAPERAELSSFAVTVKGVYVRSGSARAPLAVVSRCENEYGGAANVPAEVKGTKACRYVIPLGEIEIDLEAEALDVTGKRVSGFNGPVAFKVLPGDLSGGYEGRWGLANLGKVTATVKAIHQYGEVRVWVEDAPPKPIFDGGAQVGGPADLPAEPLQRTWATGASAPIFFDDQTLQSLQIPDGFDNRGSPFVGEFITVGKNPESGEVLLQSCTDDPLRDLQPALMVVTGLDPAGFFVTDISACRMIEKTTDSTGATQVRTPEIPEPCLVDLPDGGAAPIETTDAGTGTCQISRGTCASRANCRSYLPGSFGSMFVYNYNYPDGLNEGDLLFTLAGSVQEFTSTTQMVFPSWSIAESVRLLPPSDWDKWLKFVRPYPIGGRTCGWDDNPVPFLTDQLCGHNRRNLKMESLESGLVVVKQVRFPEVFDDCDANGDGTVPFFCESRDPNGQWLWTSCDFTSVEPEEERVERECHQNCVTGASHPGRVCTELSTFKGFGQFVVELGPAGPAWAGLDETLPARMNTGTAPAAVAPGDGGVAVGPSVRLAAFGAGVEVAVVCDQPARYKLGGDTVSAGVDDALLGAGEIVRLTPGPTDTSVAFAATGAAARCSVGENTHARINLLTRDAIPQLNVNCRTDDPDEAAATQCRYLHGATFDVIGHLRHVQPARPRWMVIPRSPFDVCCHPGPGLDCPRPISKCKE